MSTEQMEARLDPRSWGIRALGLFGDVLARGVVFDALHTAMRVQGGFELFAMGVAELRDADPCSFELRFEARPGVSFGRVAVDGVDGVFVDLALMTWSENGKSTWSRKSSEMLGVVVSWPPRQTLPASAPRLPT